MNILSILATFAFLTAHSHSWLECTMYNGNLETFERDQCLGLPRPLPGNRNVGGTFGQDIGMDFRPQAGGARCQGSPTAPSQMVTYETGQTYTLAWAPKNHVAAECTNAFIPDNFLKLYMAPYNGNTDPTQDEFRQNQVPASFSDDPHVQGQIDFKGFQNCPRFCDDTDKSLCTGTFVLPANTAPGTYTFQWYWAFNGPNDLYATCWEANVVTGSGNTGNTGTQAPETTLAPVETAPPSCNQCCDAGTYTAPGTGQEVSYSYIENLESSWISCPDGFDGEFKLMCITEEARHVDGWCMPPSSRLVSDDDSNSSGTVAGLSVALAFTILAFAAYVAITRGWVEFGDSGSYSSSKSKNVMTFEEPVHQKRRAESVFTQSNTELPVLPDAPVEVQSIQWYYVDSSDQQKGPVSQSALIANATGNTLVWNESMSDWKAAKLVPSLGL